MSTLEEGTLLGSRFRIDTLLGRGGFGTVYRAYDELVGMDVALKVLHEELLTARRLERVKREIQLARRVRSSRLVHVHELLRLEGQEGRPILAISMELVDGADLREILRAEGPLSIDRTLELTREILLSLADLHAVGVLHRDIKPANILVSSEGRVKVTDYGLALSWTDGSRLTTTDKPLGTAAYRYPETGDEICPASDLYSLAVVVYEMLTGRRLFAADGFVEVLKAHQRDTPPDVREMRPETPKSLAHWLARLLAKEPVDRYPSAEVALSVLRGNKAPWTRYGRWRHPGLPRPWLLATMIGLVVIGSSYWIRELIWSRQLDHIDPWTAERPMVARSKAGKELWRSIGEQGHAVPFRYKNEEPTAAEISFDSHQMKIGERHILRIREGNSGKVITSINIKTGLGSTFLQMGFKARFQPHIRRFDLDDDGLDELFITYTHYYWPSYTVLCDPRTAGCESIFIASGHHRVGGVADLNGDGSKEVMLVGINNLLGFRTGVAAVKIPDFPLSPDSPYRAASTPDDDYLNHDNESLLWYALLPTTAVGDAARFEVDTARNRLVLPNALGESSFELGFQGFLQPSKIPAHRRQEIRRQVYADYRRSRELRSVGRHESSKAILRDAMIQARTIHEQELVHWLETDWGRGLVEAGEPEGAQDWFEKTFDALKHDLARGYELAFQAGKAFHLAGELERAIDWYKRTNLIAKPNNVGRPHWEAFQKQLLACLELNKHDAAEELFRNYHKRFPMEKMDHEIYNAYIARRAGSPAQTIETNPLQRDLIRYWALELRHIDQGSSESLLEAVQLDLGRSSETQPMLLGLQAMILQDLGRTKEAHDAAQKAVRQLDIPHPDPILIRHHAAEIRRLPNLLKTAPQR